AICVVSGRGKLPGLRAALAGGFINELVIDEPTARLLAEESATSVTASNVRARKST
ncbi:MAG: sugar-binding transcriptional regulator, partial [Comamonadaceae bacterium]